jgi:anti-sigma28 factor (negative regulator of flagellin synthesis)
MVDATQGLTGTTTTVQVPENTSAPQVQVSPTGSSGAVSVGHSAPVNPPVDITSVTKDVLAAMKDSPPPIDIEAVAQIKSAIAANTYPVDLDKISQELVKAYDALQ